MNIADRIQGLRKSKGISQEELADKIGVSRQAVSKWESEQSLPDILKKKPDARIFSTVGSAINFIGLIAAIIMWKEKQTAVSVAIGLIVMAFGCMIFAIGQFIGENEKISSIHFGVINIWVLSLIPISSIYNCIQGMTEGHWWTFSPIPQLGNSLSIYGVCWLIYFMLCTLTDVLLLKRKFNK